MKITANGITLARMALVPVPSAMLLTGELRWIWGGFFLATALGATDAVDGYLARRDGITVLGSLLDPLADKLFTAAFFLPIVALGHAPAWLMAAVFARELLVTALRSSMELHAATLKTSRLGKLKTVVQMGGLGIYVFIVFPPAGFAPWLHVAGLVGLAVTAGVLWLRGRSPPYWLVASFPMWGAIFTLSLLLEPLDATFWLFVLIGSLTWVSGADYLGGSARTFRARGLRAFDITRMVWALTSGILPVLTVGLDRGSVVPALAGLGLNLALGGIDNVVCAETKQPMRGGFWASTLTAAGFFTATLYSASGGPAAVGPAAGAVYVLVSLVGAAMSFWNHRELFLPRPATGEVHP